MTEDLRNLIEEQPKSSFSIQAILSVVTGILSYLLIFFHSLINMGFIVAAILAPISAVIAIFTGHKAKRRDSRQQVSRGWAIPWLSLYHRGSSFLDPCFVGLGWIDRRN